MALPNEKATYRAKAINTGFGVSEEKGTKYIAVGVEVVDDENFRGETITWLGYFTDKTSARTIEALQHFGFQGDDLSELEDLDVAGCARLLPNVVEIVCEPEEYNNELQLKVRWVNRPGSGRFKAKQPLAGADLKAFAAQMKATLRNAKGPAKPNGGQRSLPTSGHPNAPGNDRGGYGGGFGGDGGPPPF